jgi:hypothetical protein
MSLAEVKFSELVKKQFHYKLNSYIGVFTSLVITQIIAILFSLGGTSGSVSSGDTYSLEMHIYSGNLILVFTLIWAIATSITMTTRAYRYEDFTFVTNRLSSNVANFGILITISLIGGITTIMSSLLLKLMIIFINNDTLISGGLTTGKEFFLGCIVSALYILLLSAVGYFIGMLGQLSKYLYIVVPLVIVGFLSQESQLIELVSFFTMETSLSFFLIKVLAIVAALYLGAAVASNRLEVRK